MPQVRSSVVTTLKLPPIRLVACTPLRRCRSLGRARGFACGIQAGIAETGDYIGIDAGRLALPDFIEDARHAQRFVVVAFNRRRPHLRADRDHLGADGGDSARALADFLGHAPGRIGIDDFDFQDQALAAPAAFGTACLSLMVQ